MSYTTPDRKTIVGEWHAQQDAAVQVEFEARIRFLSGQPRASWDRPYAAKLTRECKGLYEIRFKVNNVQHRPIGYMSGDAEFTILAFATERDRKFDPIDVCQTAISRLNTISRNKERVREFRLP